MNERPTRRDIIKLGMGASVTAALGSQIFGQQQPETISAAHLPRCAVSICWRNSPSRPTSLISNLILI